MNTFLHSPTGAVVVIVFFMIVGLWALFWKGWALWIAARNTQKGWFIALLLVNSLGLFEIFYIFFITKKRGLPAISPSPFPTPSQKPPIVVR